MFSDPVVAEVHRIREQLAARFNYDVAAIAEYARQLDAASDRKVIRRPPRYPGTPPTRPAGPSVAESILSVPRSLRDNMPENSASQPRSIVATYNSIAEPRMTEIHITRDLESDTLQLPELTPLIGRKVEIIVRDVSAAPANPWDALAALAGRDLVDPGAYRQLRDLDVNQQGM
jgi:hypothetical protein